jgi:hypothetical protein
MNKYVQVKKRFIARVTLLEHELKWDFLESLNFGPISTPCMLGTVTARQKHLHITFVYEGVQFINVLLNHKQFCGYKHKNKSSKCRNLHHLL